LPKDLSIGVVGIPVYVEGRAQEAIFCPSFTQCPRENVTARIGEIAAQTPDVRVTVQDCGELIPGAAPHPDRISVRSTHEGCFAPLGEMLVALCESHDRLVVLGGSHQAAYPTYFLPGNVLRMDQHSDDETDERWGVWTGIHNGNYVLRAFEYGLKKKEEVIHWRVRYNVNAFPWVEMYTRYLEAFVNCAGVVFDIDLASLHTQYGAVSRYGQSTEGFNTLEDIAHMFRLNQPRLLGLYEYFPAYDAGGKVTRIVAELASEWLASILDGQEA